MATDKRNATASWSGYLHQGKVGILVALREINRLIDNQKPLDDWELIYENAEDFDIQESKKIISRHQVKAKKDSYTLNSYKDAIEKFEVKGTPSNTRFLHTIVDVEGWGLTKKDYKEKFPDREYVINSNKIKLYPYPNAKNYCSIETDDLKNFSISEIIKILVDNNHPEHANKSYAERLLDSLYDQVDHEIRKSHLKGQSSYPIISFSNIYDKLINRSIEQRTILCSIRNILVEIWKEYLEEEKDDIIFETIEKVIVNIYELDDDLFKEFLVTINPSEKTIGNIDTISDVSKVLKRDNFRNIFLECIREIKKEYKLEHLGYREEKSYLLSLLWEKDRNVSSVMTNIMNNPSLSSKFYEKDYLINDSINFVPVLDHKELDKIKNNYGKDSKYEDKFTNPNMHFISVKEAIKKLNGDEVE